MVYKYKKFPKRKPKVLKLQKIINLMVKMEKKTGKPCYPFYLKPVKYIEGINLKNNILPCGKFLAVTSL